MITKQQVYLPVDVQDELPEESCKCGIIKNGEFDLSYFIKGEHYQIFDHVKSGLFHNQFEITHWLKPKEGYFFTKEQLNEYTENIIKQSLETASESCRLSKNNSNTPYGEHSSDKCGTWTVNKQSIINTFKETFNKFKV